MTHDLQRMRRWITLCEATPKIPAKLQHYTNAKNIEAIKREGLRPSSDGKVYMSHAIEKVGPLPLNPEWPNVRYHIVHINTKHPALRDHKIERRRYEFVKRGYEFTTEKPIPPEALTFDDE